MHICPISLHFPYCVSFKVGFGLVMCITYSVFEAACFAAAGSRIQHESSAQRNLEEAVPARCCTLERAGPGSVSSVPLLPCDQGLTQRDGAEGAFLIDEEQGDGDTTGTGGEREKSRRMEKKKITIGAWQREHVPKVTSVRWKSLTQNC